MAKSTIRRHLEELVGEKETQRRIRTLCVFEVLEELLRQKDKSDELAEAINVIRYTDSRATRILELAAVRLDRKDMATALRRIEQGMSQYEHKLLE